MNEDASPCAEAATIDRRLAARLKALRGECGWSLDELATRSGVSRATLSRLEKATVSPTASVLGRVCSAYGMTISRLMLTVEGEAPPLVPAADQPVWRDPEVGFRRRTVSPPAGSLEGEVLDCTLDPGTRIAYDRPPRTGLEHHLVLRQGRLTVTLGDSAYALSPGDCLRYQLFGSSVFETPPDTGARYWLFIV